MFPSSLVMLKVVQIMVLKEEKSQIAESALNNIADEVKKFSYDGKVPPLVRNWNCKTEDNSSATSRWALCEAGQVMALDDWSDTTELKRLVENITKQRTCYMKPPMRRSASARIA